MARIADSHEDCTATADFRTAFEGTNPRYPNISLGALARAAAVPPDFDRLIGEAMCSIALRSTIPASQGVRGEARGQRVDGLGNILTEFPAQDGRLGAVEQ